MKANELRIGNLVLNVRENELAKIDWIHIRNAYEYNKLWSNDFVPYNITTDWLNRLGFIRRNVSHSPYQFNDITIYPNDDNDYCIVYYKGVKLDYIVLKYVHQLQNIFYYLTGKELQTK